MSSSRHARKLMKTISKFQKISLQNKSAYEGSENKNFSWLPFGWSRASYQENFDGLNDTFNSTGIVADSIFMYANPEAAPLQHEKILLASKTKCPAQRMLDQQTTHSHPKLKDLYRRRCGLPIDANEVKDPLTDEQKRFIEKLKRCPNSPPTLDQFQATPQGYSHVKTNADLPGKAELVNELPYWVKTDTGDAVKNRFPPEGAINLRNPEAYLQANEAKGEIEKHDQIVDSEYNLPSLRTCSNKAKSSEKITTAVQEDGDFHLLDPPRYGALADIDIKSCQIESNSSLPPQNVFRSSSKIMTNKFIRFFSSNSERATGGKDKCQKLPSTVPPSSSHGKCKKVTATGCPSRARENCNPIVKQREPCEKLEAPFASYSECLKDPTPHANMSECPRKDNGPPFHCRKPKEGVSIDGCDPPGPKALGACKPRKPVPKRSNDCDEHRGGCDRDVKPFKNASSSLPSSISCPPPSMRTQISEPGPQSSRFSAPKRYYSSKGSAGKSPKSNKKDKKPFDWLKSKSPNECKKKRDKCDPKIKPFKNTAPPPASPMMRHPAPIITRVAKSSDLTTPSVPLKRYFSAIGMHKEQKRKKPCFEPRRMKPKETEKDMQSPVSCEKPDASAGNRCERAKCAPASIACKKPPQINQHRCPKKPVQGKRKKRVRVAVRKVLLGYKVCNKPPRIQPFQCKPKVVHVRKAVGQAPTEKRCPCFEPMKFEKHTGCRKMPNAVEPNCNKPRRKDSEPFGVCKKCKE